MAIDPVATDGDIVGSLINGDASRIPVVPSFADMVEFDLIVAAGSSKSSKTRSDHGIFKGYNIAVMPDDRSTIVTPHMVDRIMKIVVFIDQ